jgi:hypothetical protein
MTQAQTQVRSRDAIPPAPAEAVFRLDDVHVS